MLIVGEWDLLSLRIFGNQFKAPLAKEKASFMFHSALISVLLFGEVVPR